MHRSTALAAVLCCTENLPKAVEMGNMRHLDAGMLYCVGDNRGNENTMLLTFHGTQWRFRLDFA